MQDQHYLVPRQYEGTEKNLEFNVATGTIEDAEDWFVGAKEKLWNVNRWDQNSPAINARFKLTDIHGAIVNRKARKGDHIRIERPEPAPKIIGGFDWVIIEAIEYDDYPDVNAETFAICMRPSISPMNNKDNNILQSNCSNASTTLVVARRAKKLSALYHGRNEPGLVQSNSEILTGPWLGLTEAQWESLIKGFLTQA